jgi:folate-dependent phosphoribosylglycinamide formyltransferase PurN
MTETLLYDPVQQGGRMTIVCFVSGSGTNYQKIVQRDPDHDYVVFTNRPGCEGILKARSNRHMVIELSHLPYLQGARDRYGPGRIPRNCPERLEYEQDVWRLVEDKIEKAPDLVCLAGYDQWFTDWTIDRYYPRILNVHPGDTSRGYSGLYWIPTAKAILAGDSAIRSTVFFVDRGEDTGPVLAQSGPVDIILALKALESEGVEGLIDGFHGLVSFARGHDVAGYGAFEDMANEEQKAIMRRVCESLQSALKKEGDWQVYPFAVHDLIARGRVGVAGRAVSIDGVRMPDYGYRMDCEQQSESDRGHAP